MCIIWGLRYYGTSFVVNHMITFYVIYIIPWNPFKLKSYKVAQILCMPFTVSFEEKIATSVYLNCCSTFLTTCPHSRHLNVPCRSSGRTSLVRVTTPVTEISFPISAVDNSRNLQHHMIPKKRNKDQSQKYKKKIGTWRKWDFNISQLEFEQNLLT